MDSSMVTSHLAAHCFLRIVLSCMWNFVVPAVVRVFRGLAVQFVRECGARVMIRGVRPLTDIAAEFTMMMANRKLDMDVETVFLMADEDFAHISSSLIKQIAVMSNDQMLARFIPDEIIPDVRQKLGSGERR